MNFTVTFLCQTASFNYVLFITEEATNDIGGEKATDRLENGISSRFYNFLNFNRYNMGSNKKIDSQVFVMKVRPSISAAAGGTLIFAL